MDLKDKVVVVTGSSDGIGKETAIAFAREGANAVVTYNKNKRGGEGVFKEFNKIKKALLIQLDITDEKSIKNCVEKVVDKFGAIDVLVNNAGVVVWKDFVEQKREEINFQINTNLMGLIMTTKIVLPYMIGQKEGIILNVASEAGKSGYGGLSIYCATKFGVRGLTQSVAKEIPEIKFYCVNPGMTATKMTNYKGVSPKKVAEVIVNTAKENLGKKSGDDIDVEKY